MKKIILFFTLIFGCNAVLFAQNHLYIYREYQHTYKNGTRSKSGKPGSNYWQNQADYVIQAKVGPSNQHLMGTEKITYYNNSPHSLHKIVMKLQQNIFKKGEQRDYSFNPADITNGEEILQLKVRGQRIPSFNSADYSANNSIRPGGKKGNKSSVHSSYKISGTVMTIKLNQPLLPDHKMIINVRWSFHIPQKTHMRMGKRDKNTYFMGDWFPKVAVYDDITGWDETQYTGRQEFFNNYGNYDVSVTVPSSYGVWATGKLQNPNEVYTASFAKKVEKAFKSDSITHLISANDYKNSSRLFNQTSKTNTWKFNANNVSEFAFAYSDHYLWDAVGLDVPDGRRIRISTIYLKSSKHFNRVIHLARQVIHFFSYQLPDVPFPFPKMTVVNGKFPGGDGMEYPMMCNNPTAPHRTRRVDVTSHEIAHNYFPFYVGTNERQRAWMDEGWADLFTTAYMQTTKSWSKRLYRYVQQMNKLGGKNMTALPIMTPSTSENGKNYMFLSYFKPVLAYHFLHLYLGDKLYKKALQGYINRWKYKHPTPYDFFYSFNNLTGKNLNWYWNAWFFRVNWADLNIANVKKVSDGYKINITNKGGLPLPVKVELVYQDGSTQKVSKSLGIWKNRSKPVVIHAKKHLKKVILVGKLIPDIASEDNSYEVDG
jgi:hypothetical protein